MKKESVKEKDKFKKTTHKELEHENLNLGLKKRTVKEDNDTSKLPKIPI